MITLHQVLLTAEYLSVNMTLFRVYNVHTLLCVPLLHHSIPLTNSSQGSVTILAGSGWYGNLI